jgi:hypothetical protein
VIITPDPHPLDFSKSDLIRSPGLHASDIYSALYARLDPKRYDFAGPPNTLLMALGTAWENQLEYLLIANGVKAYRPGELTSPEGVHYSPDLIIQNGETRVGEIKLTSMGFDELPTEEATSFPPKFSKYECQMMLYTYWLELQHGWLGMVSIRKPWAPEFRAYNIQWSPQELISNWQMCMNFAKSEGML